MSSVSVGWKYYSTVHYYCPSLPISTCNDVTLPAWTRPRQRYSHRGEEQTLQTRAGFVFWVVFVFFFFQKAGCETLTSTGLGSRVTCHDLVFTMGSARTPKEQHGNAEQRAANSARPRHHPCDFSQYSCEETQLERLLRVFSVPQFAYL